MKDRQMNTTTRTAPAVSAKAVAYRTVRLPRSLRRYSGADRMGRTEPRAEHGYTPDFGPISRAEMRAIVAEMIG